MAVRIGLVGCGRWGKLILRDLKQLGCHVSVVAKSEDGVANARAGGSDGLYPRIPDLPEVDAAVVAVHTIHHAAVVQELIPRDIPIFCEKPLTCDVGDAERIVERAGERVFVMDKWRYHGGVRELATIARSGELGPVQGMQSVRLGWGNHHDDVNCAWILMPHDLSIAQEVLGGLGTPVLARAQVAGGRLWGLHAWLDGPAWHRIEVGARSPEHRRRIELVCRDGVAVLADSYDDAVLIARNPAPDNAADGAYEKRPIPTALPLQAELEAFLAHVAGGPAPSSSAQEGLATVRTIARVHELAGISTRIP
jgi:predicted dehydrogenase